MASGVNAFRPNGDFVVRRLMTTDREYQPGERFNKGSVTPRRLRQLFDSRRILPIEAMQREFSTLHTQGPLTVWRKGEDQAGRHSHVEETVPAEAAEASEADAGMTVEQAIALSDRPFFTFKKAAAEVLGDDMPEHPNKANLLAALEAKRDGTS